MYQFFTKKSGIAHALYRKIWLIMRLTTVILIISLLQVTASTFGQRITMNQHDVPLSSVLKEIRKQSGYDVFYDSKIISKDEKVSVKLSGATVEEAMTRVLKGLPLTFEVGEKEINIKKRDEPSFLERLIARFQAIDVRGKVLDENGQPLAGATVRVKGTNRSVTTNNDGVFFIQNVDEDAVLEISYVGYKTREVKAAKEIGDIKMEMGSSDLEEVNVEVNTGYQTLPKERATGSFAQVDNKLFNRRVSTDVLSRLEGVVPGLLFNRNTGAASQGVTDISIRGYSTLFSDAQPLIVVDNFPYDGRIQNINPNDVESITVLKDAAAASIWGSRSGNGVIVITTKKGKLNQKTTAEINTNLTIAEKPNLWYSPNYINTTDFIDLELEMYNKGYYDDEILDAAQPISPVIAILARRDAGSISASEASKQIDDLRKVDRRDGLLKYFYQKNVNQQYNANIRGGTTNSNFAFSLGYDNNKSNLVGNTNDRYTLNANYNYSLNKDWQLSSLVNFIQTNENINTVLNDTKYFAGGRSYPYVRFSDEGNNALPITKDLNPLWLADPTSQEGLLDWNFRPLDELRLADNKEKLSDARVSLGTSYRFLDGFSAEIKYAYQRSINIHENYNSIDSYYARNIINRFTNVNGSPRNPVPIGGILYKGNNVTNSNRFRGQLNYAHDFNNNHNLTAIFGTEVSNVINENDNVLTYGYNKENKTFQNVDFVNQYPFIPSFGQTAQIPSNLSFYRITDRYVSYFGNASYSYFSKYIVSLSGRIDKSNLFGVNTNQKSVPLYSVGVSWDMSRENFFPSKLLSQSKLRVTYGYNGNVNKSAAALTTLRQQSGSWYNGLVYSQVNTPGNPELRWEKVKMLNIGYDFSFKNQILTGSIEFYQKRSVDLFATSALAPSTGFSSFFGNTASTEGRGWDIVLTSNNIKSDSFKWATDLLYSYALDKVVDYYNEPTNGGAIESGAVGGYIYPVEGKPVFSVYSYPSAGLDPQTGDPRGYVNGEISNDYQNILNVPFENLKFHGTSRPTSFGSLKNTFSYKQLALSFNLVYKFDYYFFKSSVQYSSLFNYGIAHQDYYKRWQNPGDEMSTNVPSLQYPPVDELRDLFYTRSSELVLKGDHIRLQDIMLSYELSRNAKNKLPFESLTVYSYINNVGLLWKANKDGLDPDLYYGRNADTFPLQKTFAIGIKATF
ncbi:TonB-linked SusC/RagA family outer membrane protein [Pedobacter sp. AK017]|uniref:SusC/RagA family TonB-linked outer membrane protein n=1 Tax=Pedobacter sp. AK017 TaxID=2723073 RepID=UPI00161270CD|nr:SusC/RagA family TonB-linked outer membrane protein [Pedobacter sp. AK017]MBB5440609.1 TonB-linked SusC/RagA family outer membrane protein [Pedobacter sp. AK017]